MQYLQSLEKTHFFTAILGSAYTFCVANSERLQTYRGGVLVEPIPAILYTNTLLSIASLALGFLKKTDQTPRLSPTKRAISHGCTWGTNLYILAQLASFLYALSQMRFEITILDQNPKVEFSW